MRLKLAFPTVMPFEVKVRREITSMFAINSNLTNVTKKIFNGYGYKSVCVAIYEGRNGT